MHSNRSWVCVHVCPVARAPAERNKQEHAVGGDYYNHHRLQRKEYFRFFQIRSQHSNSLHWRTTFKLSIQLPKLKELAMWCNLSYLYFV